MFEIRAKFSFLLAHLLFMCLEGKVWWQVSGSFLFGRFKAGQSSRHSDWEWLGLLQSLFRWLFTSFQCELGIKLSLGTFANIAFLFSFISWHFLNEEALKAQVLPCCFQHSSASTCDEFLLVEAIFFFFPTALATPALEVMTCLTWISQCGISFLGARPGRIALWQHQAPL